MGTVIQADHVSVTRCHLRLFCVTIVHFVRIDEFITHRNGYLGTEIDGKARIGRLQHEKHRHRDTVHLELDSDFLLVRIGVKSAGIGMIEESANLEAHHVFVQREQGKGTGLPGNTAVRFIEIPVVREKRVHADETLHTEGELHRNRFAARTVLGRPCSRSRPADNRSGCGCAINLAGRGIYAADSSRSGHIAIQISLGDGGCLRFDRGCNGSFLQDWCRFHSRLLGGFCNNFARGRSGRFGSRSRFSRSLSGYCRSFGGLSRRCRGGSLREREHRRYHNNPKCCHFLVHITLRLDIHLSL